MRKSRVGRARGAEVPPDEVLPEYDFSRSRPNTYASRYRRLALVVTLDPDVAAVFGGARKVNEVLRALAEVIHGQGAGRKSRRSAQQVRVTSASGDPAAGPAPVQSGRPLPLTARRATEWRNR